MPGIDSKKAQAEEEASSSASYSRDASNAGPGTGDIVHNNHFAGGVMPARPPSRTRAHEPMIMRWEKEVQLKIVVGDCGPSDLSSPSSDATVKRIRRRRNRDQPSASDFGSDHDDVYDDIGMDNLDDDSDMRPYVAPPASKARIKNHTSTLVDEYRIIVFGGYDGRRNHNTIRILDTRGMRWISEVPVTGTVPDGRNGHSATLAEGKLYIIGGWLGQGPLAAKDMHIFDVATSHWSEARTTGAPPGPCNMHTCDYVPRRRELYLFRGGDGQNYLNDLHVLNIDTMVWRSPATGGNPPSPRANHASAVVGSRLYIFGGWMASGA